ncbi:MAG: glycoside hydrolase family 9 protein [Halococcoides sp.]
MVEIQSQNRRTVLKSVGGLTAAGVIGMGAGSALAAPSTDDKAIRVNQVGYPKNGQKMALVTSAKADLASVSNFEVVDVDTGESVYSGSLSDSYADGFAEGITSSGTSVKRALFTDVTTAGTYKVTAGSYESHPFKIDSADAVYGELLASVGRLYTLKRANADIQDPVTGLDIGPGHMEDQNATIAEPSTSDFLKDYSAGDTIDVTKGWYDAGDYGKYVITHGITAAQMMLAYERNPDAFGVGDFAIPDSIGDSNVGSMPDVLAEAKWGLQFLQNMQRPDGALFYKVAGKEWSGEVKPENDTINRYVFGLSSAGTANGVAAFAMAARVFKGHDDEFASTMLDAAKKGYQWLQNNPDLVWEKSVKQDGGSGGYGRSGTDVPDRYWAYAELLRTTGDTKYEDAIGNLDSYTPAGGSSAISLPSVDAKPPLDWGDPASLGHYAYGSYAKANNITSGDPATARKALRKTYWLWQRYAGPDHTRPNDAYTTGLYDYYWGCAKSGVSRALMGQWGLDLSTVSYVPGGNEDWLMGPVHHVLGRSATGYSYVTDFGETSTQNPHDRIIQSTGTLIPGMLVGGPHDNLYSNLQGDCTSEYVPQGTPNALAYADKHCSYATNEWAINYTAPLFGALAEFDGVKAVPPGTGQITTTTDTPTDTTTTTTDSSSGEPTWPTDPAPTDPNGDGLYEDLSGNGQIDFPDVNTLFQNSDTAKVRDNAQFYDFEDSGTINLQDVMALFRMV